MSGLNGLKKRSLHFILHFIFACLCSAAHANDANMNIREKETAILDQMLANGKYDARIRPSGINGTDGPALIHAEVVVRNIEIIDDAKQEYSVQLTLRGKWVDERLKFDDLGGDLKYLSLSAVERIWMPDLFFSNEKESHSHNMVTPNFYLRIFPSGLVYYSTRISLTLTCFMNFKLYPFDRQYCQLRLASYGSMTSDVVMLWNEDGAVQVVKNSGTIGNFKLIGFSHDYCSSNSSKYSCLRVNFSFERNLMYYFILIYIPSFVFVLASWVSFWLDQDAVTARVLLGVTTLLAMAIQGSNISASLPPAHFFKAVDVWTGVCLIFIFAALLEFASLNYALRYDRERKCVEATIQEVPNLIQNESDESMVSQQKWASYFKYSLTRLSKVSRSKKIDLASRIMFPIAFAIFNLAYWITYLTADDEY